MANISTKIADALTKHGIDLMRVDASLRQKIIRMINGLEDELVKSLKKYDITAPAQLKFKNSRFEAFLQNANDDSKQVYSDIYKSMQGDLVDLAKAETIQTVNIVNRALNVELMTGRINQNVLNAMVNGALVDGAIMKDWWTKANDQLKFDVERTLRDGVLLNEPVPKLIQRIRGTQANGFKDGIMQAKRYQAAKIVRSSVMTVANTARGKTYEQNKDVMNGVQWLSTLDTRTSDTCKVLDGEAWDFNGEPIGNTTETWLGYPPAHPNCRSTTLPVLKSWDELAKTKKPAVRNILKKHNIFLN